MRPELSVTTKDVMALSDVSERTAKRRLAKIKGRGFNRYLATYCNAFDVEIAEAKAYVIGKRYDGLHSTRTKRVQKLPYSYQISTWEETYHKGHQTRKLHFCEFDFYEPDEKTVSGRLRYFTVPTEYIEFHENFEIPLLSSFVKKALPVERKLELLGYYGRMVLKRKRQKRIGMISHFVVRQDRVLDFTSALRRHFANSKKIWFCKVGLLDESERRALGFREIQGSGFAVAGVPGWRRAGRSDVGLLGDG